MARSRASGTGYFYPRPPRGGRHQQRGCLSLLQYFYPRPPRGGRRVGRLYFAAVGIFLSTPSARRATVMYSNPSEGHTISIHALREEGDYASRNLSLSVILFLSTPSARRATPRAPRPAYRAAISIHALREEGDVLVISDVSQVLDFYPRPPRGGRPLRYSRSRMMP